MTRVARLLLAVAALVAPLANTATAAGASTAVVVIDTGANVRAAVIHFSGSISGIDALQLAGGNPTTYGFTGNGAAVCSIDGVGNPANESCLVGPHSEYWAYFLAHGGSTSWAYSRGCACTTTVHDGDVEGWRYGTGAAPRSSADFCAYVACPPPPTSPPVGGGTGTAPATTVPSGAPVVQGGDRAGSTDPATTGLGPEGSSEPTTPTTAPTATVPPTSTTSTSTTSRPRDRDGAQVEAAAVHRKGGGGGADTTGSPAGVLIAAGALAATAGAAVWLRRRRTALR